MQIANVVWGMWALNLVACSGHGGGFQDDAGDATSSDATAGCHSAADCDDHTSCTMDACLVGGVCSNTPIAGACGAGMTCVSGTGCTAGMCTSQAQCNDSIACTTDNCLVGGTCQHTANNNLCPPGQMCNTTTGCVASCASSADCNDNVDCTTDTCGVNGQCVHTAVNARCTGGRMCNPTMGCVMVSSCGSDAQCDDGIFCNGAEHCSSELACVAGTPPNCTTTDPCMVGSCSETMRRCVVMANPSCMAGSPGTYLVNMPVHASCTDILGGIATSINVDFVTMTVTSSGLSATAGSTMASGSPPTMMGAAPAADGSFSVTSTRAGGCNEVYTMTGRFTTATTFTATLSVSYNGPDCSLTNCMATSWMFMGTLRMM